MAGPERETHNRRISDARIDGHIGIIVGAGNGRGRTTAWLPADKACRLNVLSAVRIALAAFAKGLSDRGAADGVTIHTVAPAFVATPVTDERMKSCAEETGDSFEEAISIGLAEKRLRIARRSRGEAVEVAAVIALVVCERTTFVTAPICSSTAVRCRRLRRER